MSSCPSLNIPGFTHSVTEYFLPDIHRMLGGMSSAPGPSQNKRFKANNNSAKVFHALLYYSFCDWKLFFCNSKNLIIVSYSVISFGKELCFLHGLRPASPTHSEITLLSPKALATFENWQHICLVNL